MNAKTLLLALLFVVFGCRPLAAEANANHTNELTIILNTDKTIYRLDEEIRISISLKNVGDEDIVVNKRMALTFLGAPEEIRDIALIIIGPSGETVSFTARPMVRPLLKSDFVVLNPGGFVGDSYNIENMYDLNDIGTYTVKGIYTNTQDPIGGSVAWKGELLSNSVMFEIIP